MSFRITYPYLSFIFSFCLLLVLILIASIVRTTVLEYLPSTLRAISYMVLVCVIVAVWSLITYKVFRKIERRGLKISQN